MQQHVPTTTAPQGGTSLQPSTTAAHNNINETAAGATRLRLVSSAHGFADYDVVGHQDVHRICIPDALRRGDICNVYGPGSTKRGAPWAGSVELTLSRFLGGVPVVLEAPLSEQGGPDYWYTHRAELAPGQVFRMGDGSVVKLDRRVPGDGSKWYVADWCNGWRHQDSTIEPGDLRGDPIGDSPAAIEQIAPRRSGTSATLKARAARPR